MSTRRPAPNRRAVTWTAAIAVPVAAAAALLVPMAANGAVDLPDKTPKELIEFAAASEVDALSGTIEQTSELGLPDLAGLTGAGEDEGAAAGTPAGIDDLIDLATGSHTAKVYLDGDLARMQVLDRLAERNVYLDGAAGEAWFVDSETQTATKLILPDPAGTTDEAAPDAAMPTPEDLLDQALAGLDETSEVSVGTDSRVAGRDVYELVITPRTDDTLVGELRFAVDGQNGVALAASVTARGASAPAFEIAFTQVDFTAPDASVFAFSPGDGVAVTEEDLSAVSGYDRAVPGDAPAPAVLGEGWSSVVVMPGTGVDPFAGLDPEQQALMDQLTTAVDGGRVLQTSLVSVMIADDGRLLVGAVPAQRLVEAAQTGR